MRIPIDKDVTERLLEPVVTNRRWLTATAAAVITLASLVADAVADAKQPQNVPVDRLGGEYRLVGKLHVPLGDVVKVEGIVVEGPSKGYEGGPNLRVQRIQGQATQEDIQIMLAPYLSEWGEKAISGISLPELETGKTYRMEGYETGGYIGAPPKAYRNAGVEFQTAWHYFRSRLVVYKAEAIKPLRFTPADFESRRALMQGTARTENHQSVMEGDGWSVIVAAGSPWPKHVEGKLIETYGLYKPDANLRNAEVKCKQFVLIDGTWRLVRLEDQLGQTVTLRSYPSSFGSPTSWGNIPSSFRYRGTPVFVENMPELLRWREVCESGRPVVVHGKLERAQLPQGYTPFPRPQPDLKEYYFLTKASWEPFPGSKLLAVERPKEEE
jgi:hypothetical protein